MRCAPVLVCAGLLGCSRPPEAPTELEDLTAFLYDHAADRSDRAVEDGIANLVAWLEEHLAEMEEGYEVANLDQATLDALDDQPRSNEDLVGAAVSTDCPFHPTELAEALVVADQTDVYPNTYRTFDREFVTDEDCFVAVDCDRVELTNHAVTSLPFGIRLTVDSTGQFRWVDTEGGPALLTRAWLHGPAEANVDVLRLDAQYHLSATVPLSTGVARLQATWVDAEIIGLDVPEGTALNMLINSFRNGDADLYDYVETQ